MKNNNSVGAELKTSADEQASVDDDFFARFSAIKQQVDALSARFNLSEPPDNKPAVISVNGIKNIPGTAIAMLRAHEGMLPGSTGLPVAYGMPLPLVHKSPVEIASSFYTKEAVSPDPDALAAEANASIVRWYKANSGFSQVKPRAIQKNSVAAGTEVKSEFRAAQNELENINGKIRQNRLEHYYASQEKKRYELEADGYYSSAKRRESAADDCRDPEDRRLYQRKADEARSEGQSCASKAEEATQRMQKYDREHAVLLREQRRAEMEVEECRLRLGAAGGVQDAPPRRTGNLFT